MRFHELSLDARSIVDLYRRYLYSDNSAYDQTWYDDYDFDVTSSFHPIKQTPFAQMIITVYSGDDTNTLIAIFELSNMKLMHVTHCNNDALMCSTIVQRDASNDKLQLFNMKTNAFENV